MIVDVNLGANSGIDLIRTSISAKVDCKFIVLTIHDDLETLNSAKAAGACAYVTKGAPIENLIEVIQSISSIDQNFVKSQDSGSIKRTSKAYDDITLFTAELLKIRSEKNLQSN